MKNATPVPDDMFERARKAFFGIAETSPKNEENTRADSVSKRLEKTKHNREVVTA
jgi:hypothetical protein